MVKTLLIDFNMLTKLYLSHSVGVDILSLAGYLIHVLFKGIGAMKFYLNIGFLLHYYSVQAFI